MKEKLMGKVAVVTGASKGIGAAIARHFAAEGASVIVNYMSSEDAAGRVVKGIVDTGGKAIAVQGDISQQKDIQNVFSAAIKAFGRVDILVNNAGSYEFEPIEKVTAEHYHKMFNLNVLGLLLASQEAVKHFDAAGGSIINISSVISTVTPPGTSVYSATKAAVDAITKSLAKELGSRNIRVNSINPGMVDTEGFQAMGLAESDMRTAVEAQTPLGRIGQPDDIGPTAVFLASADSSWITGEILVVAGAFVN